MFSPVVSTAPSPLRYSAGERVHSPNAPNPRTFENKLPPIAADAQTTQTPASFAFPADIKPEPPIGTEPGGLPPVSYLLSPQVNLEADETLDSSPEKTTRKARDSHQVVP